MEEVETALANTKLPLPLKISSVPVSNGNCANTYLGREPLGLRFFLSRRYEVRFRS